MDEKGNVRMSDIMSANKVKYQLPTNLNIVDMRHNIVNYADQNSYSSTNGNQVLVRLNATTAYIYGKNSYLTFDVSCKNAANDTSNSIGFKNSTAMSIFSRVLYEDKSGADLERNDSVNRYVAQVKPLHWNKDYSHTGLAMAGQFQNSDPIYDATTGIPAVNNYGKNGSIVNYNTNQNKLTVIIPLHWFLGVFSNETLIPASLVSGSLVRLTLASAGEAFEKIDGGASEVASFELSNVRIVLDSLHLNPTVSKNLLEQSQSGGGLDYCYETAYWQQGSVQTTNENFQINKAVSRCQRLYWSVRAENTPVSSEKDNMGTALCNVSSLDYRLGSAFFPQKAITVLGNNPQKNGAELYQNTLQSIHRMKSSIDPPSISKQKFLNDGVAVSNVAADNNNNGSAIHCQSFEMSTALEYSGLAINNSRTLEARINFVNVPTPLILDSWICYLKLAKCNAIRAVIKE